MVSQLIEKHRDRLKAAVAAWESREYYAAFDESPSPRVYGEHAAPDGKAAFEAWFGEAFPLTTPGAEGTVATEHSPYGFDLGVSYPRARSADELVTAAAGVMPGWRDAGVDTRVGICLEILDRLHERIFELANAVQHTSGQAFVMSFQAGGAHALDRALESISLAWHEQNRVPGTAIWEKKGDRIEKTFTVVPSGVALVIGCNTFPTWNSWPGLFASLACGNPVIVKPHPRAVLPLAITVQVCQEVLAEAGFRPELVTLAAEEPADHLAAVLAVDSRVKLIDFTGGSAFGDWLVAHATQAVVFAEKAGVNTIVLDSTDDFAGMCRNLAFSLSLYSGQMCTTPQNLLLPGDGMATDEGQKSQKEVAEGIAIALDGLLGDDARAVELLGAIVNDAVVGRIDSAALAGEVLVPSRAVTHPAYPHAVVRTPMLVAVPAEDDVHQKECFGPVTYLVRTGSTDDSIDLFRSTVLEHGAMTAAVYSSNEEVLEKTRGAALDAAVALSENLLGGVFVNQTAAYSDFHGTGANPAANAAYADVAFVANRFHVVASRRHV